MPAETATIDTVKHGNRPPEGWALPAGRVDRRSREWRRRCELVETYSAALGGPSEIDAMMADKIATAADLAVVAELARARVMACEPDARIDDVVRAENAAGRAFRALGIKQASKPKRNLSDYLRDRSGAAA